MPAAPIDHFSQFDHPSGGITRTIYKTGDGPPVLVMHEMPGLAPEAVRFAERLAREHFTVYLPLLFGKPLQNDVRGSNKELCVSREFANLEAGVSAPITDWLRSVARELSARHAGGPVGAIGMCLTGAFVIPLILEPQVTAPVAAQPGMPFSPTFYATGLGGGKWKEQVNVSDEHIRAAAERLRRDGLTLLTFRFSSDRICPAERIERLQRDFAGCIESHELKGGGARVLFKPPHATLTVEYERGSDEPDDPTRVTFARLVAFLRERLGS